ncbi:MAG TPA: NAD(P)/FAD-dependent oxidoreductase [Anaerolineae bacterium]
MYDRRDGKLRVVIVGAGFGGLWAAKALTGAPVDVLLVDQHNYHTFLPLLYQVGSAELEPGYIAHPIRMILRRRKNVRFLLAKVSSVDVAARAVKTTGHNHETTRTIPYDYLILATGSVSRYFGIPGAAKYAFNLKTMEDGIELRNHILQRFEKAWLEPDEARRRLLLTFTVVGGGPTGVEYAGALSELVYGPLAKDFRGMNIGEVRIILLEALDRLLAAMPEKLGRYAVERLEQKKVEVRLGATVSEVAPECVYLKDGTAIPTTTVIWTAGVGGEDVARQSGLPTLRNGTVPVLPTLQVANHPEVYVIGDLAAFEEEDDSYLPMLAPVAIQQGERAAKNIRRQVTGQEPLPFKYRDRGTMATIGRSAAVADIAGFAFTGFFAWIIWLVIHLAELIGFRNRLVVLVNWAWTYIFYERVVRLILPGEAGSREHDELEQVTNE